MLKQLEHPPHVEVWVAMAEHFLDTETRHDIPLTAMRCLEAGLSPDQAREVWCFEVSPAVAFNAWDVAGEWAAWDRQWLVQRIGELRKIWSNQPGPIQWCLYRARVHFLHGVWVAIERCMEAIAEVSAERREPMSKDLSFLARHYFDFYLGRRTVDRKMFDRLQAL